MSDLRLLVVTTSLERAPDLVRTLCEERWIACGNIVPGVRSIYRWEGRVCDDEEALLWMETTADRLEGAMIRIAELHHYAVPKIVAVTPTAVHEPYAIWARESTRSPA